MAKKKIIPISAPEVHERVWSEKYKCSISKANAVYSELEKSWINEFIENNLKR